MSQVATTCGLVQSDPLAQNHAPAFQALWDEGHEISKEEDKLYLQEAIAQGKVKWRDRGLDVFVKKLEKTVLLRVDGDRNAAEYKVWFSSKRVSELTAYVLGPELEWTSSWVTPLTNSTDPTMKALGAELGQIVVDANQAVADRAAAWEATNQFRNVGRRKQYIDKVNAQRKATYGQLSELPHTQAGVGLPNTFADRFFEHASRQEVQEQTVEQVQRNIEGLQAQIKVQEGLLAQVQKQAQDTTEQEKRTAALRAELVEANKTADEARKRIESLQSQLR